ncbi:Arf family guanine nucleotide exchange factor YEL1 KNAG_0B02400 [Huiozyma naganishii CBS 8797]|uniref:Guanine-nucleotide exchange factor YEL1 n=1 Tax=Huiozyma naganishii (strain ATCC MYA-139 / BCRC 22969 / CBS 8797 / KCTC 17520 / NBRC 10181 / NCYC 3082 / Yp74L-3) TaxID=1071383 RepID=J7RUY0_HUIN7|nr:hypothetical protein KNAG_0B02400 [Kazachstania naganishii CBS 8797]CCK68682.1 hypothetical protein KNAG_0B02400 [Kazachstania naganishii CBS 8797]
MNVDRFEATGRRGETLTSGVAPAEDVVPLRSAGRGAIMESPKMTNISHFARRQPSLAESETSDDFAGGDYWSDSRNSLLTAMEILDGSFAQVSYKEYANYLGHKDNFSVLTRFIDLLKPFPVSLLSLLVKLSSSVYLIAESQNIDKILEELSRQWVMEHPGTVWKLNYKLCHIVLFSLLILNSDLHNEETKSAHTRFSQESFVRNTLSALELELGKSELVLSDIQSALTHELASYYEALKHSPLPVFRGRPNASLSPTSTVTSPNIGRSINQSRTEDGSSLSRTHSMARSYYSMSSLNTTIRDRRQTATWKSHNGVDLPRLYLREPFDEEQISWRNPLWCMNFVVRINEGGYRQLRKFEGGASAYSRDSVGTAASSSSSISYKSSKRSSIFRWLKRPLLQKKSKSLFETSRTSMSFLERDSQWTRVRVCIQEGRVFILRGRESDEFTGDVESLKKLSDTTYFVYSLFEAQAQLIQEQVVIGGRTRVGDTPYNFNLLFPETAGGGQLVLQFQADDADTATNYVDCINFWAGRLSSVPTTQFDIVSNEEYGWSHGVLAQGDSSSPTPHISRWRPLLTIDAFQDDVDYIPEPLPLQERLREISEFIGLLSKAIDEHNAVKPRLIDRWGPSSGAASDNSTFELVMDNWNSRYLYLHGQYEKREVYYKALSRAAAILST